MRSEDEVVDALRRAHRVAADQVDERPDPSVRAAILAAAARAVDAPRSTAKPPGEARVATRRWPLSAAAVLAVAAVTALLASQVLRDGSERITTIAAATPQPPRAAASSTASPAAPAVAVQEAPADQAVVDERGRARRFELTHALKAAPPPHGPEAVVRPRPVEHEARMAPREREVAVPSTAPPPAQTAAPDAASSSAVDRASADQPRAAATRDGTAPSALLAPATVTAHRQVGRAAEPDTPEAWVARIVRLRVAGHDGEADRELEGLRRRYPGFEIPAGALPPPADR